MKGFEMKNFEGHITLPEIKEAYAKIVDYFRNNQYWRVYFVNDVEIHFIFTGACLRPDFLEKIREDLGLESIWVTYAPAWDYQGLIVCGEFKKTKE